MTQDNNTDTPMKRPSTFVVALAMTVILLFGMLMFLAGQANANTAGISHPGSDAPERVWTCPAPSAFRTWTLKPGTSVCYDRHGVTHPATPEFK